VDQQKNDKINSTLAKPIFKSFIPGTYRPLGGLTVSSQEGRSLIPDRFLNMKLANNYALP